MKLDAVASDAEIKRALMRDRDVGFTMLVVRFQPGIYSGARRLTHRHQDAEEVAQETFLRAYRALNDYDDNRVGSLKLSGWLWTIAINLCRTRAVTHSKRKPVEAHSPVGQSDATPLDTSVWNLRLDRLSTNQRAAVVLRHVADLSVADIAVIVERPVGTVKADISRGLDRLRETIANEGAA